MPVLRLVNKTRYDRISFDIGQYTLPFLRVADPMIEGFILPESRAGAAKDKIRVPGRSAFDLLSDLCEWRMRRDQHVNVVCHYYVRM